MMRIMWRWLTIVCLVSQCDVSVAEEGTVTSTYTHGRFTVEVLSTGSQRVVGGEFIPPTFMPQTPSTTLKRTGVAPRHVLFMNYVTKELQYYRRKETGAYLPVRGYAVVTPEADFLPRDIVRGEVVQLIEKPTWCPKVGGQVRRAYPSLPPGCLPYGHTLNPMGDFRFDVAWDVPGWQLVRLHGTTGYPEGKFWDEETFGCVRLVNDSLRRLIEELGPTAVVEGIELVSHRTVRSLAHLGE